MKEAKKIMLLKATSLIIALTTADLSGTSQTREPTSSSKNKAGLGALLKFLLVPH